MNRYLYLLPVVLTVSSFASDLYNDHFSVFSVTSTLATALPSLFVIDRGLFKINTLSSISLVLWLVGYIPTLMLLLFTPNTFGSAAMYAILFIPLVVIGSALAIVALIANLFRKTP